MAYEVILAVAEHNELDFDWEQHLEPEFFKASSIAVVVFVFLCVRLVRGFNTGLCTCVGVFVFCIA